MPKANWEESCSKCIYGTTETRTKLAKGRCTNKHPKQHYDYELEHWVCDSFVRRWDTREDLERSKLERK